MYNTMEYTDSITHFSFLESMIHEQNEMADYISECVILSNPNKKYVLNELASFNEGAFGDKVKGMFARLKSFFSRIWQKFLEKLNAWSMDNKKYLEEYKDIILGKKVTLESVKMRNHKVGVERIINIYKNKVNSFAIPLQFDIKKDVDPENTNSVDAINKSASDNMSGDNEARNAAEKAYTRGQYTSVLKTLDINLGANLSDDDELNGIAASLTSYFNGGNEDETWSTSEINDNMPHMFDMLYQYNDYVAGLNKMKDAFVSAMDKNEKAYISQFEKMKKLANTENEGNKVDATESQKTSGAEAGSALDKALKDAKKDNAKNEAFSRVYGKAINEVDVKIDRGSSSAAGSSAGTDSDRPDTVKSGTNKIDTSSNKKAGTDISKKGTDTAAQIKSGTDTEGAANKATVRFANQNMRQASSEQLDNFQSHATALIKAYSTVRTTIFGSMLNGLQNMRGDYMAIVRAHVNSYLGAVNNPDSDTSRKSSTDKDTNL